MKGQNSLKLFEGQVRGKLSTLLSLFVLVPILLAACVSALPEEDAQSEAVAPVVEEVQVTSEDETVSETANLAENPELMAAGRYNAPVIDNEAASGSAFLATNPELSVAGRYRYVAPVVEDEVISDSMIFAENPELKVVRQYEAVLKK